MNENTQKKLYIKTWGCQMNVYDSNRMADILSPLGYKQVEAPDDADMVILNTCHIREKATDKVFSELGRLREHQDKKKENGGKMLMAVAGCVAQAEGELIMKRAQYVDMVFGPQTYHELPEMVIRATGERVVNTEMVTESKFDKLPEENISQGPTAFLSIQEGCDKFCTFCVVPYTRGAEYSRSVREVVDEAKRLADTGAREITLLGQNVNAYHGEDETGKTWSLGRLIAAVADINGIERVRYSTSHPRDMDQELIDAHRDIPECMPFLHLPIQSGSNKLLKTMNRKHDRDLYFKIIEDVRKGRPDIALSSDFIVGFPGETDQDFEDTMDLIERVNFSSAYSFIYSPRPGTPAANMQQQLHDKIKSERLTRLQALLAEQQKQFNANTVGKDVTVIFDRRGRQDNQYLGRSEYNQAVHVVANEDLFGQMRKVRVTASTQSSLTAELVA